MALFEDLTGVPAINRETINPARFDQRWLVHALTETRAHHTIAETLRKAAGPDIDQFRHEICIRCGGGCIQLDLDRPSHFNIFDQWLGHINEDIITAFDGRVVVGTAYLRGPWIGDEGDGTRGIVAVLIGWFTGSRRRGRKRAVTKTAIGLPTTVQ